MSEQAEGAFDWIVGKLGVAATALAAICATAYILGYAYLNAFYSRLGVPWVMDLYGPTDVAQVPSVLAVLAIAIGGSLFANGGMGEATWKGALVTLGLAGLATIAHFGTKKFLPGYTSYFILIAWFLLWLGVLIGASVYVRTVVRNQGARRGVVVLCVLAIFTMCQAANPLAEWRASRILSSQGEGLPDAVLGVEASRQWKLVRAVPSGKVLLMASKPSVQFRVVPVEELKLISSARRAEASAKKAVEVRLVE